MSCARQWSREETELLISQLELLPALWDVSSEEYKNRNLRVRATNALATSFDTSPKEISRKLHNLRTQFNCELRKMKSKKVDRWSDGVHQSSWHFFESMKFMISSATGKENAADNLTTHEVEYVPGTCDIPNEDLQPPPPKRKKVSTKEDEVLDKALILLSQQQEQMDAEQIFGNFVASTLRGLKSVQLKGLLRRKIQKSILDVEEMEAGGLVLFPGPSASSSSVPSTSTHQHGIETDTFKVKSEHTV